MADKPLMIEVPAEEFALLMMYCHTQSPDVPDWVDKHPNYPRNRNFSKGHLTRTLRPYAKQALEMIRGR